MYFYVYWYLVKGFGLVYILFYNFILSINMKIYIYGLLDVSMWKEVFWKVLMFIDKIREEGLVSFRSYRVFILRKDKEFWVVLEFSWIVGDM